jgi:hypothetical protein
MLNRRQFLSFTAASTASLTLSACYKAPSKTLPDAKNAQGHYLWQNWSGSEHAYPSQRVAPNTLDELKQVLSRWRQLLFVVWEQGIRLMANAPPKAHY